MDDEEEGSYGKFGTILPEFVAQKFETLGKLLFISRTPTRMEYLEMHSLFTLAELEESYFNFLTFEALDNNITLFQRTVHNTIVEWGAEEGLYDMSVTNQFGPNNESFSQYDLSGEFPSKSTSLFVYYRDDVALICIEKPWFPLNDEGSDPNDNWKNG